MERTSKTIERELNQTRCELDETARALKQKLSAEHLKEQTRVYLEESVQSAGALIRRHPIPAALAGALFVGGLLGRASRKAPSTSGNGNHATARRLLQDLIETAQQGSTRVKEVFEHSASSAGDHDGGVLSRIEGIAHEVRRRAEHGAHAVGPVSNRELALFSIIATLLGATVGTTLKARRLAHEPGRL
jgi:hypothetical protein